MQHPGGGFWGDNNDIILPSTLVHKVLVNGNNDNQAWLSLITTKILNQARWLA